MDKIVTIFKVLFITVPIIILVLNVMNIVSVFLCTHYSKCIVF